jgi:hypothetical protein
VQLSSQDFKDLLLDKDKDGRSAWHLAAERDHMELLEKLWAWEKGVQLSSQNFKNLLLDKDKD